MLVLRMKWPEMSHDAALRAGLEHFTQRTKTVDSCCKWSPSKDFLCKSFGIDAAGWSENAFVFQSQWEFSFYPLSKIRETKELGHHEENVTGSSVERRDFVATACSLYPQTDLIQRNLSTAKPFSWQYPTPFPLCGSTRLQFYADKMSGLHLSPSLLPVEKPASAFLMKDLLCTQICGEGTRST